VGSIFRDHSLRVVILGVGRDEIDLKLVSASAVTDRRLSRGWTLFMTVNRFISSIMGSHKMRRGRISYRIAGVGFQKFHQIPADATTKFKSRNIPNRGVD
jgi:hypothetical protein